MSAPRLTAAMERGVAEYLSALDEFNAAYAESIANERSGRRSPAVTKRWVAAQERLYDDEIRDKGAVLSAYVAELARTRSALRAAVEALEWNAKHRRECPLPSCTRDVYLDRALTAAREALDGKKENTDGE
jgi:hypothetical protein